MGQGVGQGGSRGTTGVHGWSNRVNGFPWGSRGGSKRLKWEPTGVHMLFKSGQRGSMGGHKGIIGRGRPEPATSYKQPTTYQQFDSGTGSGSANKFSGLVPFPVEKCRNVAGFTNKLPVKPAICCWFRL